MIRNSVASRTKRQLLAIAGAGIAAAGLIALIEARAVWGYAIWEPSLEMRVGAIERIMEISDVDLTGGVLTPMTNDALFARAQMCQREGTCRGADWILIRALDGAFTGRTPRVPSDRWRSEWQQLERDGLQPGVWIGHDWKRLGPARGIVVYFRARSREWLFIGYNTERGPDDRYAYAEALYSLNARGSELVAHTQYYYDVDHVPELGLPLLWFANAALVFVGLGIMGAAKRVHLRYGRATVGLAAVMFAFAVIAYFRFITHAMTAPGRSPALLFAVVAILLVMPATLSMYIVTTRRT